MSPCAAQPPKLCVTCCTVCAPLQIAVYGAAGSRYAELPSELYDVALAFIADAAANAQPEQLERALGALTAAARATPPGATGQVGRAWGGLELKMK